MIGTLKREPCATCRNKVVLWAQTNYRNEPLYDKPPICECAIGNEADANSVCPQYVQRWTSER